MIRTLTAASSDLFDRAHPADGDAEAKEFRRSVWRQANADAERLGEVVEVVDEDGRGVYRASPPQR